VIDDRALETVSAEAVGVGLREAYYRDFLDGTPPIAWLEVHAENYFDVGGIPRRILSEIAERYPVSVHGVALSVGSADGLNAAHLDRLAALVETLRPPLVSEHLAWSRFEGTYYNDLLPLPLTEESLGVVGENVARTQDRLGRRLLIENPSAYVRFAEPTMSEPEFLSRLVEKTGCGILLDVNNLYVSAWNVGVDPMAYLLGLPREAVGEIHLAGHENSRARGASLLIDTHGCPIAPPVWDLYAQTLKILGPRPTLIEWDSDVPELGVVLADARHAERVLYQPESERRAGAA